jgi:AbrB family looped-hinge helix DNA binding protein
MSTEPKLTAMVSTKGEMILPAAVRRRRHWTAGTRLLIEETPEGVLLRTAPAFETRRPFEFFNAFSFDKIGEDL